MKPFIEAAEPPPVWRSVARRGRERLLRDLLGHPLAAWRHRQTLRQAQPNGQHAYTCFFRSPLQLQAIGGPLLDRLGGTGQPMARSTIPKRWAVSPTSTASTASTTSNNSTMSPTAAIAADGASGHVDKLRILLFACATGAEAYSLAAWLQARRPGLAFEIVASDWQASLVTRAREGIYTRDEVFQGRAIDPAWIARTFVVESDRWVVNERTRAPVRFETANLLRDDLAARFGQADVVLAQNVLFHLHPVEAQRAFANLCATLAPRAALAIEGMDLDQRQRLTRAAGLVPLEWRVRDIHEAGRSHVAERWWAYRYGCEPWLPWRPDKARRYGTLFLTASCTDTTDITGTTGTTETPFRTARTIRMDGMDGQGGVDGAGDVGGPGKHPHSTSRAAA
jgi:hypothetical protein